MARRISTMASAVALLLASAAQGFTSAQATELSNNLKLSGKTVRVCEEGQCHKACEIHMTLQNVGLDEDVEVEFRISYHDPGHTVNEEPVALDTSYIWMKFPPLSKGASAEAMNDPEDQPRFKCSRVKIKTFDVFCTKRGEGIKYVKCDIAYGEAPELHLKAGHLKLNP
jgi:hypothetical protein